MEPLRGGNLVNGLPGEVIDIFDYSENKMEPAEWGLKWLWNDSRVHIVLSGMSTMDQVKSNIQYAHKSDANGMSKEELQTIENVKEIFNQKN